MSERFDYKRAAEYLAVKPGTLRSMVHRKQIPHIKLTDRIVVFDKEAIDAWLADRSVNVKAGAS